MPVRFSLKSSFLVLLGGLICAALTAFLVNFFLAGPGLGFHYDFLLNRKKPPPVSHEILIIETDEFIDSGDIFSVLLTLTEMEAANLLFTGRVSPSSSPVTVTEAEIRRRFIEEYIILSTNIRNLFDAIRSGSVSPVQAPLYVNRLVELTEQGRDRLLAALINRDENLLRVIAVFENYLETDSKPQLDRDRKLRRVRPVDPESSEEHPVFFSLKNRYADSQIETIEEKQVLWLLGHDGSELDIPLDSNGNIITPWNCSFRRIGIKLFLEYDEAGRAMRSALVRADELGAFSQTLPEQSPLILGDYALMLREEMLQSPSTVEKREEWIRARENYFKSLDEFLNGHAEAVLVNGYDEVIAGETSLNERGLAALAGMRDELKQSFAVMREEFDKLSGIHAALREDLAMSFCIMGPEISADYSALLANALITGSHVKPVDSLYVFLFSLAASFVVLLIVFLMRPALVLIFGLSSSAAAAVAFSCVFIFYSYWLDPLVVLSSSLFGTFFVFYCKCAIINRRARLFRSAYGTAVSPVVLKELIRQGRPHLSDVVAAAAAVIAIKDINLLKREDAVKLQDAGKHKKAFYAWVKDIVYDAGAAIVGIEGDTILACFGSPLDKSVNPVYRACAFVKELLNNEKISWRFGIDAGECTFYWSAETGYSVNGRPAVRARILVSKTARLKSRALVTGFIREMIGDNTNKTDTLKPVETLFDGSEPVYEFPL
ncbi:MAG: hypothetical protein LBQ93_02270 [Treponema sp.]|jgi:class 3 adenylate cyclase|nr:hypothetical protein [Treponema sp.]